MKLISVDHLQDGMILAENLYNSDGVVYLNEGSELRKRQKILLKNLGIFYLYIEEENFSDVPEENSEKHKKVILNKEFKGTLSAFKSVYTAVYLGQEPVVEEVRKQLAPMISTVLTDNDILGNLRSIEVVDEYIFKHSVNVSLLAAILAKWLGYSEQQVLEVSTAGLLHDVGMANIPKDILNKPGLLEDDEFEIVKSHVQTGYDLLKKSSGISEDILNGVLHHHEKMDGSGYPNGIKGEQIHPYGRILAIADVFDAMTNDRVYSNKASAFEVADVMMTMCPDHLDIEMVQVFIKNISRFFIGNKVELNTGFIGEVIMINPYHVTRPLLKNQSDFLDLSKDYNLRIIDILGDSSIV